MIFFLLFLFFRPLISAQYAVVMVDQAVVYADINRSFPIGYVSSGKRILVGEVPRHKKTLLPMIIGGRIAYIKISDISLRGKKGDPIADASYKNYLKRITELKKKPSKDGLTFLNFYTGWGGWGRDVENLMNSLNRDSKNHFSFYSAFEKRSLFHLWSWEVGPSLRYFKKNPVSLSLLSFEGAVYYTYWWEKVHFALDFFAGSLISFSCNLKVDETSSKGTAFGVKGGMRSRLKASSRVDMSFSLFYKLLKVTDLNNPSIEDVDYFSGLEFHMGILYDF